jgi:hypothetical protein
VVLLSPQLLRFRAFSIKLQNCNLKPKKRNLNLKLLLRLLLTEAEVEVVVVVKARVLTTKKENNLPNNDLLEVEN